MNDQNHYRRVFVECHRMNRYPVFMEIIIKKIEN